ncbi:putative vacuolar iron transporter Ccc1 [Calycina marina]|uniref:Vacuolar iron transporter Ccc1 n=1 Tax=Calycina marina TaxID=1763456 RepID=A0A9P7YW42_9HELO|nr:putative vacuolar iron transporter Ccc1 [Calycina marina]
MSVALIKNIFFKKTVTPVPRRRTRPVSGFNNAEQPLLQPFEGIDSIGSNDTDIESQISSEKSSAPAARIDAQVIRDATIAARSDFASAVGLSDGLTVPFALTAGLSALGNTKVVIYGGIAELIAGMISMGLGGYLGAKSEAHSYEAQRRQTCEDVISKRSELLNNVDSVFELYELPQNILDDIKSHLDKSSKLADFVMQFELCTMKPAQSRPLISGITIAIGYGLGGLLPLLPYFFVSKDQVYKALNISIAVMVVVLFVFGYGKTCVVDGWRGGQNIRAGCGGGVQMVCVGGAAAACAMGLVKAFDQEGGSAMSF